MLFEELSVAVLHGMTLDEALVSCMRTAHQRSTSDLSSEPGSRWFYPKGIMGAILVALYIGAIGILLGVLTDGDFGGFGLFWVGILLSYFVVLFTTSLLPDVERVARVLALRLLPYIRAGHSLAAAMEMLPRDYSKEEINIIRAGEGWGNLPRALQNLGRYQLYERKMLRHWARMSYPVWLLLFMLMIGLFCVIFIIPKFKDIYDQLGAPLPRASEILLNMGEAVVGFGIWLPIIIWAALVIFTVRQFMGGNRLVRDVTAIILTTITTSAAVALVLRLNEDVPLVFGGTGLTILVVCAALLAVILAAALLFQMEESVLGFEKWSNRLFGSIPWVGAPRRTEMESRWLATLSLALDSGIEAPAAVEAAGDAVSISMAERSRKAAALVRQGHSIGQAVVEADTLRTPYANRLRLLDGRAGYLQGLADIAEDAARDSYQTMNRASRIVEVASVSIIGVGVGLFAYAMYMPLFSIPLIVGHW